MYFIEDENFAKRLRDEEIAYETYKRQQEEREKENLNPVDSVLEYLDPTPSIHDLFVKFDKKFFWGKLGMVQVAWSNRMTMCAGVCSFQSRGGLCKIALSAPLLSLRPRKDLVETLLHEMIHAYLFVTRNFRDREDHGPEFHKHMYRINHEAGTKITVYHSFIDEVQYYQKHVWRCNGTCQQKKPYFGFLRRAVNRPPGPRDPWWNQHQMECGGTFIKISEPEKPVKKTKKTVVTPVQKHKDIRDFFTTAGTSHTGNKSNIKTLSDIKGKAQTGLKTNAGSGTVVVTNSKKGKKSNNKVSHSQTKKTSNNIATIPKDEKNSGQINESNNSSVDVKETVRNFWANKYTSAKQTNTNPKKAKVQCPVCSEDFSQDDIQSHAEKCLENTNNSDKENGYTDCPVCSARILHYEVDNHMQNCLNLSFSEEDIKEIEMGSSDSQNENSNNTDNEYKNCSVCNKKILESEMNDHLEECLNCSFVNEENNEDDIMCESVPCPCCYKWFLESEMNSHIDECLTFSILKEEVLAT